MSVLYSVNLKPFKDFNVFVSKSKGIGDGLKRKKMQTYSWAEYSGSSVDLKNPKFEARDIELTCFVVGENWEEMQENFSAFMKEFEKPNTQRIHITPFGYKTIPFQVYNEESVILEKDFSKGKMVGVFTLKLTEPNPIKKVLKTSLDKFKLAFDSTSETEIFFGDGTMQTARGNVSVTKDYGKPSYESSGITLISQSPVNDEYYEAYAQPAGVSPYRFSVNYTLLAAKNVILYVIGRNGSGAPYFVVESEIFSGKTGINTIEAFAEKDLSETGKFIYKILDDAGQEITGLTYIAPRIEKSEVIGEWQNVLGKEKIIIIAGNVDEIKNLTTEAETLWEKI